MSDDSELKNKERRGINILLLISLIIMIIGIAIKIYDARFIN
ncbi:hypothetical protein [Pseudoalteromonas sp. SA25]|nr:hypothetical protein [Pseudoalteromonas sp. SA25]